MTWVRAWVRPMPMWWRRPLTRRVTQPESSTRSWRTRSWVSASRSVPGWLWAGVVGGGRGGPVRQGAVRAVVVVVVDEGVEQGLQLGDGGRLGGLGAQPLLHGLLESFDLAAGGGVVGAGVLLDDVQAAQLVLEAVAAAAAAGEPGGEDHAVVGQRGGGIPVLVCGFAEGGEHDRAGDPGVGGDVQGVAGVVVEPGEDLDVRAGWPSGR